MAFSKSAGPFDREIGAIDSIEFEIRNRRNFRIVI